MIKRVFRTAVICLLGLSVSGCLFLHLFGISGPDFREATAEQIIRTRFGADAQTVSCLEFGGNRYDCAYHIGGSRFTSTITFTAELELFAILVDPLVLELPGDATGIAGTYTSDSGASGDLVVYPNLAYIPVDDDETLTPAPGRQLVVVDLPEGAFVEGANYSFRLAFEQDLPDGSTPEPVEVKAMFVGKVRPSGLGTEVKTYYPPLLPCTSDFATVPSISVPEGEELMPLTLPIAVAGCVNKQYTFSEQPSACDQDNDNDVDRADLALIMAQRNLAVAAGDPRDINDDGVVNANDARRCVLRCTRPRCAS